jgi:hypothetical protein
MTSSGFCAKALAGISNTTASKMIIANFMAFPQK